MQNLRDKTLAGLGWSAGAKIAKQALQFIISVILIRLLRPEDFGLIGVIMVFTGFVSLFSEIGLGSAIIQKKHIEERHRSTIFWVNLMMGLLLAGITLATSSMIAKFFNEPRLKILIMVISINFFLGSLNIMQTAILHRSMDFRKLAIIETVSITVAGFFAIAFAFLDYGVWSLVWQTVISTTIGVILIWHLSDWKPCLQFNIDAAKELASFSGNLFGFNVFNYWVRNIDDLLIGKLFGSASLGLYNRAYSIMLMPLNQISFTVGQVMFPALSKIQDDKLRVKYLYLSTISIIALITFPMMLGLLVVANSFVLALFGQKWAELIPIIQIFCLLGVKQSVGTTTGWIYTSQGRTDWMLRWGIVAGGLLILSIIIGIILGNIISVAACYALMSGIVLGYHSFAIPGRLINMTFREVICSVSGAFCCAAMMSASVFLLGEVLSPKWAPWMNLAVQVPFGIIIYFALIHIFKLKAYIDVRELFREEWQTHFVWKGEK